MLALAGLALPQTATFAAEPVRSLAVEGARTVPHETVQALVTVRAGAPADPGEVDRSLKALMATGHFADVAIEQRGERLVVRVVENPLIASVAVEGAAKIERKTLDAELQLKAGGRLSQARLNADARRLRELYRRRGRYDTAVEPTARPRPDGRVDVVFAVREAEVAKVERIAFRGNRSIQASRLRDVVTTSESGWLDILKSAAFYDPERIEADREAIRRHYADNGFPDARVTGVEAVRQEAGFLVTFVVDEGRPARFGKASMESRIEGRLPDAVGAALKVKGGQRYSREAVDRTTETMTEALSKAGHPFARVEAVHRTARDGETIDIVFRIEAGPPMHVERIEITGNKRTRDHVIRQAMRLAEGDPVNAFLIERARARVMALGFFKTVAAKPAKGSAPGKAVITFEVVEQETGDVGFGAGYSSVEGVVGDISWTERNLFGNGQYLRFKVSGSAVRWQADIGFTEPRFLGSNVAAGFDLVYKDVDYTKQASYSTTRAGGTVRAGMPLDDNWSTGVSYTYARNTLYNVGPLASAAVKDAIPGWPANGSATWDTSSIGTSVTYDSRDNKRKPGAGVVYTLTQDFAGAGGDVRYVRETGEARAYYTVADGVTAMGRVQGGVIAGWGGQDVRLLDLFNKGGETVRGFATAGIGPRDLGSANQDALGGRMFMATTAEARFDIPGVPKDMGLTAAVFADAGSLWGTSKRAATLPGVAGNTPALRASAGVGLAWDSPLGPLRVDYAVPLVKQPYDKTQPLSFGLMPF